MIKKHLSPNIVRIENSDTPESPPSKGRKDAKKTALFIMACLVFFLAGIITTIAIQNFDSFTKILIQNSQTSETYTLDGRTLTIYSDNYFDSDYQKFKGTHEEPSVNIQNVIIKSGVTRIGTEAFYCCKNLQNVTIPATVTEIGAWAFESCTSLTKIDIPNSVTTIGDGAFKECQNLSEIIIPEGVTVIDDDVFYNCPKLKSVTLPDGITKISYGAFQFCTSLTDISIPDSVIKIGDLAFEDCTNISSITLPAGATRLCYHIFQNWTDNQTIYIKDRDTAPDTWNVAWNANCDAKIIFGA